MVGRRQGRQNETWTAADVPDQTGRTAIVTGGNTGIGFEAATVLAERGATVVLACRTPERAAAAAERIAASVSAGARASAGAVSTVRLDLASLTSVREAAAQLRDDHPRIDLLVNNAGVMIPPYARTEDGFELQFGTNHLGHFALTGLLLDHLRAVPGSRIVTVSSNGHRIGRIRFEDLQWARGYRKIAAYGQSKLANLLFTYELQRRLESAGAETIAVAAHPGTASTELERHISPLNQALSRFVPRQPAAMGALPTLRAATDPGVRGGEYFGPGGRAQFAGNPVRVDSSRRSHDRETARRLWQVSEELTGIRYDFANRTADAR